LHTILSSSMTPEDWAKQEIFYKGFETMPFVFQGSALKGQMLQKKFGVDIKNLQDGTFYRFQDYCRDHGLISDNPYIESIDGMRLLFETAGINPKTRNISEVALNSIKLREILLSLKDPQEWGENTKDFHGMIFDIPGIRNFAGEALREAYAESAGRLIGVETLFSIGGIPYGNKIQRSNEAAESYQQQMTEIFENPHPLRSGLLQIMSKEEWATPKPFVKTRVRAKPIDLGGRQMDLHTLMCNYSTYEHNKENPDDIVSLGQAQDSEEYSHIPLSSREVMDKICSIAGIETKWIPDLGDFNLHSRDFLERLIANATYDGAPVSPDRLREMGSDWRKVEIVDSQTGLKVKLRTLVQNHSAYDTWIRDYPNETLNTVAIEKHRGKVNQEALNTLLVEAGV